MLSRARVSGARPARPAGPARAARAARAARPGIRRRKTVAAITALGLAGLTVGAATALSTSAQAATTGLVRVDQAGFLAGDVKQAYLMTGGAVSGAKFSVLNAAGKTVLTGKVGGTSLGKWNTAYPDVYPIVFSGLTTVGTYHIKVAGSATATSPSFTITGAGALYGKLVTDGVTFFQTQRDGSNVIPGSLDRQPSHLHDGRVAAAFALAAQVDAAGNPTQAAAEYQAAASVYAQADTSAPPNLLTTALPNAYYPEPIWHDAMELGGAELALAAQKLGHSPSAYLSQAATYAKDYIASDTGDTFNLYDNSALAHADLIKAIAAAGKPSGLAVTPAALTADLKRQVQSAAGKAAADAFHAGGNYADFDVDAHTFGFLTEEALYRQASGDKSFDAFATEQRDWLLGANAWGLAFMVGEGSDFPKCMQHQVANLSGSLTGTGAIATGAVMNGPNNTSNFSGGLGSYQDGMKQCPAGGTDAYNKFTGHSSRFSDDVRSWQTDEPALDMTGSAVLGAAMQETLGG